MESLRGGGALAGSAVRSLGNAGKSRLSKLGRGTKRAPSKKRAGGGKKRAGKKGAGNKDPSVVASEQPITMDAQLELTLRANAASRDKETAELKKQAAENLGKVDADKDAEFLCRLCLGPGERRRCCEEWYCNACYYRGKECPSCGHKVQERTLGAVEDAGGEKLTSTLVLSFFFFAAIFGSAALTIYHYITVPTTLHGQTCAGFLPSCQPGCVEHNADDSTVTLDGPMPTLQKWKPCSRSSKYKIRNPICVVDRTLYERSNRKWGYDFCVTRADRTFDPSLIVFEDDMNDAANAKLSYAYRWHLASAKWRYVVNGARSSFCGALDDRNVETKDKTTLPPVDAKQKGLGVMHFYGDMEREAVTEPIDLEHGGRLEFWFKYAKGHYQGCEVQYDGETVLHYSTDDGASWTAWYPLNRILWRNRELQLFREEVPEQARSKQTMFKWKQTLFNPLRDHWALDDVRVLRTPAVDWRNTDEFKRNVAEGAAFLDRASCCLDSFGCRSVGDKTKWNNDTCADVFSDPDHGKFDALGDNIKGRELVVFVAICVWLMRFCFDVLVWMVTHRCAPPKRILLWQPVFHFIDQTFGQFLRWVTAKPDQSIMPSKPSMKGLGAMGAIQKAQNKLKMKAGMNSNTRTRYDAKFRTRFDMKWRKTYHGVVVFSFLVTLPCLFFFQVLTRRSLLRVALALPVGLRPEGLWKNPRNLEAECAAHYSLEQCTRGDPLTGASVCIWNDQEGYSRAAGRGYCTLQDAVRLRLPPQKRWDYPIPYAILALAAACLDLLLTQHVMRHVVCITEAGAPRYEFDGRRNQMHITNLGWGKDQTIDLAQVTELRQFPIKTARNMALQVLFMSLPLLSLTLLSTNVFFTVALGALCVFRSVLGPLSLVKFFWTVQYIYASVIVCNPQFDYLRIELANALFRPYTLFQMVLWAGFGAPFGIGLLWVFDLPWNVNLQIIIAGFAMLGACVSCVQGIAVTPMVFLTCLDVGFFVRYVKEQNLPRVGCLSGETIAKVTRCEAMLVAYVDNQPRFNDLLRGIPVDADDVADMATHLKYQYSSEDSEGDDDVLDNTTVAAHLFAAQSECFQGHDGSDDSESDGLSDADAQGDNPTTAPVDGRKRLPSLSQNMKPAAVAVTEI